MRIWIKLMVILAIISALLAACSSNVEQVEEEAPIGTDNSTNEFPETVSYTEVPPNIDPAKGYFVDEIADGVYWVIGSHYQTMFLTTGEGVIVIDAPQPMGESYLNAIKEVTNEPITHVIYSHAHSDHIGAAGIFPPDIDYIAHQDTVDLLSGVPEPTITFVDSYTLEIGTQVLELSYIGTFHSQGDIVIYAPRQKVAMVVDLFHPGSTPFAGFGATIDLDAHLQAHELLIKDYDFNVMVPGHTEILATKTHLETNRSFILSMQEIVEQAISSVSPEEVVQTCMNNTIEEWDGVIQNLEDRVEANCRKMEEFISSQVASVQNLPVRSLPRTETTGSVPHMQIGVEPVAEVNEELIRLAFALPGVENRPTIVSLPGALGMWLNDSVPVVRPEVIVSGREFAHIHPDGSLHAALPVERALEAVEKGWAEMHPWADQRDGWEGFVMLFTPQSFEELEVIFQLIVESYNHVTGLNLDASHFTQLEDSDSYSNDEGYGGYP